MLGELFHLHFISPRPQTWPSLFHCNAKGFQNLTSFFPSPKIGALVQSEFEFEKEPTFLLLAKLPKPILEIGKYSKVHLHIFLCIQQPCEYFCKNPFPFLFYLNRKRIGKGDLFFLWPKPSPPGPARPGLEPMPEEVRGRRLSRRMDPKATAERLSTVAAVPSGELSHSRRPRGQPGVDVAGEEPPI